MKACKLCGTEAQRLNQELEDIVINMIKQEHPEWVESDGACQRCLEYYDKLESEIEVIM